MGPRNARGPFFVWSSVAPAGKNMNETSCPAGGTNSGGARVELYWDEQSIPEESEADRRAGHRLVVVGHGEIVNQHKGPLVGPRELVGKADLESLVSATRDQRRCCSSLPEVILLAPDAKESFDKELFDPLPFHLEIGEDFVHVTIAVLTSQPIASKNDYRTLLRRATEPHGCQVESVRFTDENGLEAEDIAALFPDGFPEETAALLAQESSRPRFVEVLVTPKTPMKAADLLAAGADAHVLLTALSDGRVDTPHTAAQLVRAGLPHLLSGMPESEWLEVKKMPYNLKAPRPSGTAQKFELAKDVARFANGDNDAVLVVGMSSTKIDGRDVVQSVHSAKLSKLSPDSYQQIIDARVYPTIEGLKIHRVDLGNGKGVLLIEVPAQPGEYKPFLVHGAIVGERFDGAFISIVRRRGEGSTTLAPSNIHAMLAAGRAYLNPNQDRRRDLQ